MSVIFIPALSSGSATRLPITFCGAEPVPTLWRPSMLRSISGFTPSFSARITQNPPRQSSRIGRPFLMWSFPFIPSFAVQPPAVTATHLYAPDFTNAAASISAWVGAAQNPLASDPDALTSPATSAAAFAKLPPPLWFMSPHASSAQSITYSTSAFSIPALRTA